MKLEKEIETFFQTWCSDFAPKAKKLFVDAIDKRTAQLLTEKLSYPDIDLVQLANSELFKLQPKFALEAAELFNRIMRSKLPARKVDVAKILREQVRLARAKGQVNHYRRII
jgi:hypothetical protein